MKRIDYEQYLQDFNCVHGKEVNQAIYKFFEGESEIKLFLDLVDGTTGKVQYDFYNLLLDKIYSKGYSLTGVSMSYSRFQRLKSLLCLSLYIDLREKHNKFFVENNYRFLQDLL
jgi:hypothetical protein